MGTVRARPGASGLRLDPLDYGPGTMDVMVVSVDDPTVTVPIVRTVTIREVADTVVME